jgi:putative DNA primase/helicase
MTANIEELKAREAHLTSLLAQITQYESVPARKNALESASWEPGVRVSPDDLNRHPLLLNVQNGTLELETLKLREHRREDLLTQIAPVPYDPAATCPKFEAFLEQALPDDEVRAFAQRAAGYSATGLVRDHVLFFLHGSGGNGKTTFLNALMGALGADYAAPASPKLLIKRSHDEHLTEIASLYGKRLVVCSESGEGAQLDEEKVKLLTGGDHLTARRMREDPWSFTPTHTLWLQSNHAPRIRGTDEGIWRRVRVVPFTVRPKEENPDLGRELEAEYPGILTWTIRGLRDYLEQGLAPPESVLAATESYRYEQDVIGRYLAERVAPAPGERVQASALYRDYRAWCEQNGESPKTVSHFGTTLSDRGLRKAKAGVYFYLDVEVRS